ncbi:MAG: DUF362 domain-containing protein [Acidobacteriota bacterium]
MITRRDFVKGSAMAVGAAAAPAWMGCAGKALVPHPGLVVSVAADDILKGESYDPLVVHRVFESGLKELTGEKSLRNAWSSMFTAEDVVGVKINCIAWPKVSSSEASIREVIAGLQSAGVRENNIIIWEHADTAFRRTALQVNRSSRGVRIHGTSPGAATRVPWVEGYDHEVYIELEDGTLKKFRQLIERDFTKTGSHREIFNSVTWLWMLIAQGNEKAQKYAKDVQRLYTDYNDREGVKRMAEEVADLFNDLVIEDEGRSYFSNIVTKDITKLINIPVLKHNEDSGVTLCLKNVALGVTTNKVRFHIDYCTRSIAEIMSAPCIKDKLVLNIGEAAKISTVSVVGQQMAYDNRIFFSRDPVAMDRIGLDLLERKRREQGLEPITEISTHVAASAQKGIGTADPAGIDLRELSV